MKSQHEELGFIMLKNPKEKIRQSKETRSLLVEDGCSDIVLVAVSRTAEDDTDAALDDTVAALDETDAAEEICDVADATTDDSEEPADDSVSVARELVADAITEVSDSITDVAEAMTEVADETAPDADEMASEADDRTDDTEETASSAELWAEITVANMAQNKYRYIASIASTKTRGQRPLPDDCATRKIAKVADAVGQHCRDDACSLLPALFFHHSQPEVAATLGMSCAEASSPVGV